MNKCANYAEYVQWYDSQFTLEEKKTWIRSYGEGVGTQSRDWTLTMVKDGESLLDIGYGPGCDYENFKVHNRQITYRGYDFAPGFMAACKELFPEGDFRVGDAMSIPEPDASWDTVLLRHVLENTPEFETPICEALRVARKRVIIIMWRPLLPGPDDNIRYLDIGSNDYSRPKFMHFLQNTKLPLEQHEWGGQRPNWAFVLHKTLPECIFDLDDFSTQTATALPLLLDLKAKYPQLRATLFAIPGWSTQEFLQEAASWGWVELALHGWAHQPNTECELWMRDDANRYLDQAEAWGCFVHGFKAPGWRIGPNTLTVLAERGYWIAGQLTDINKFSEYGLRAYFTNHYNSVHGHMQNIYQNQWWLRNGLDQLVHERGLPWDTDTQFKLVSEVVE